MSEPIPSKTPRTDAECNDDFLCNAKSFGGDDSIYVSADFARTLEIELDETNEENQSLLVQQDIHVREIQTLLGQIEVKDEALRRCRDAIYGYKDCNGLAKDSVLHIAMDKAFDALTKPPAAAKELLARLELLERESRDGDSALNCCIDRNQELLEQNERMKVAIQHYIDTCEDEYCTFGQLADAKLQLKQALSTPTQPAKG